MDRGLLAYFLFKKKKSHENPTQAFADPGIKHKLIKLLLNV